MDSERGLSSPADAREILWKLARATALGSVRNPCKMSEPKHTPQPDPCPSRYPGRPVRIAYILGAYWTMSLSW